MGARKDWNKTGFRNRTRYEQDQEQQDELKQNKI